MINMEIKVFLSFFIISSIKGMTIPRDHQASVESFPYIVSIEKSGFHFCSGIILNTNSILSAASCFDLIEPFDLQFLRVKAGSSEPYKDGISVKVSSYLIHKDHVNINITYDAVIVQLQENLTFSDKIAPAFLADRGSDIPADTIVNITGYGLNEYAPSTMNLKYAEVKIIGQEECKKVWPQKTARNQLLCAGNSEEDVCDGDAGAPMTLGGELIGYSSLLSCNDGKPSLFTKISSIRSWMKQNAGV